MSRIDYSRTTIKINELIARVEKLEKNLPKIIQKIMIRIDKIEQEAKNEK